MQCHSQAFLSACWKSLPHALSLVAEGAHEDGERLCCKGTQSMTLLAIMGAMHFVEKNVVMTETEKIDQRASYYQVVFAAGYLEMMMARARAVTPLCCHFLS